MSGIYFLKSASNREKVNRICGTIAGLCHEGQKVLVRTPNAQAAEYLDTLLWKTPAASFIPHEIADRASLFPVVITASKKNPNGALVLFNVSQDLPENRDEFHTIYELLDLTDPSKEKASRAKQESYGSFEVI